MGAGPQGPSGARRPASGPEGGAGRGRGGTGAAAYVTPRTARRVVDRAGGRAGHGRRAGGDPPPVARSSRPGSASSGWRRRARSRARRLTGSATPARRPGRPGPPDTGRDRRHLLPTSRHRHHGRGLRPHLAPDRAARGLAAAASRPRLGGGHLRTRYGGVEAARRAVDPAATRAPHARRAGLPDPRGAGRCPGPLVASSSCATATPTATGSSSTQRDRVVSAAPYDGRARLWSLTLVRGRDNRWRVRANSFVGYGNVVPTT